MLTLCVTTRAFAYLRIFAHFGLAHQMTPTNAEWLVVTPSDGFVLGLLQKQTHFSFAYPQNCSCQLPSEGTGKCALLRALPCSLGWEDMDVSPPGVTPLCYIILYWNKRGENGKPTGEQGAKSGDIP
ncbi:hypothetical protein POVWA2_010190 [Plasmodium ovale wallikeri]|uniref:PIR Superfamily Protein n=1 Tax=Plasmodium ovale wallikeri TaxID=864142 RepID=A0A1A8YLV0_PLAOA|nr:hypothetical protein POVWA2_010190 [Plasmodium ovale wallikeri]